MPKRVLVIDNYDSFVYVLVQYLGCLGSEPLVYRNDAEQLLEAAIDEAFDAILISPGPKRPEDAGQSLEIINKFSGKLPILGVCLGHQCIAQAFGANVVCDDQVTHGKTSEIDHDGEYIFNDLSTPFVATRYHSLIVEPNSVPEELIVSATSSDGRIMGLRHKNHPTYGIQFHPESVLTAEGMPLLKNFLSLI